MNTVDGPVPPPVPPLPTRLPESHKGTYGRVLIVGGSRGMSGAPALSGMAALRSGAGLVTLCVPDACCQAVASFDPCTMTIPCATNPDTGTFSTAAISEVLAACNAADVVAIGPGLGHNEDTIELVHTVHSECLKPMVIDADALNCLATSTPVRNMAPLRILTPHPGEFRRLIDQRDLPLIDCREKAASFARDNGAILVLKGHRSIVTDGDRLHHNPTGNPGMATGGSGDVLTGVIAALVGQQFDPFEASVLGTFLHGRAGDLAATELGQEGLVATDLIRFLPEAFRLHPHTDAPTNKVSDA